MEDSSSASASVTPNASSDEPHLTGDALVGDGLSGDELGGDGSDQGDKETLLTSNASERGKKRSCTTGVTDGPLPKKGTKRSWVWLHFRLIQINGEDRAECHYCGNTVVGNSKKGTSVMSNHLNRCSVYPPNVDKTQKLIALNKTNAGDASGVDVGDDALGRRRGKLEFWNFNQQDTRKALCKMIIKDEMPFRVVDREGFRAFMDVACPHFHIPSRWTVARDCIGTYNEERSKLKNYFSTCSSRICLTTDTWTSCQNLGYMCLTAHWIGENWRLYKKIINFCPIVGHTGEAIGKAVESCLIEWGITKKVMTVTVDNASANDVGIEYLRERFVTWRGAVLEGKFLHMRCVAHILNLTVREGLKESDESIDRIRHAVRFVRSSPARKLKFKNCVKQEQIDSKRHLCLDVETRWNSTYLMLEGAVIYRKAFKKLEKSDNGKFKSDLEKGKGVPDDSDWERVESLLPFLKIFYDATMRLSGSLYVTSNMYLQELVAIGMMIKNKCKSDDLGVKLMAHGMLKKHQKYWDNVENINLFLYVAVVLDPRRKMPYVDWALNLQYDLVKVHKLHDKIVLTLNSLYDHYASSQPQAQSVPNPPPIVDLGSQESADMDDYMNMVESQFEKDVGVNYSEEKKSDLDKYLEDVREMNQKDFDVLEWWNKRKEAYPILSLMARDVLSIPVSTVASESAFSTGGRVLDSFRSSLSPTMVEALICSQDWLRSTHGPLLVEECIEEVEKIEKELLAESSGSADDIAEYY